MNKVEQYQQTLATLEDWQPFLLSESKLPGPRANLELAAAVAAQGNAEIFNQLRAYDAARAPANTPEEFLAVCGVIGLGKLLCEGRLELFSDLRLHASDPRWRIRESVCIALQAFGKKDINALIEILETWSQGSLLERRAAAAALCEPVLLKEKSSAQRVLGLLDQITASLLLESDRRSADFKTLRKSLGYCWSVAAAAEPTTGLAFIEKWLSSPDRDIRWIMKENLGKKRLLRLNADWVQESLTKLTAASPAQSN